MFFKGNDEADAILDQATLERLRTSVGVESQIPVYDSQDVVLGTSRSLTIADAENAAQLYTIVWTPITFGFTVTPSRFLNNEHQMQADYQRKLLKFIYKVAATLDSTCLSALALNKSQIFADELDYTVVANTIVAEDGQKDNIIGDLEPIMNANDFYGNFHILGGSGLQSQINKMREHGGFNDKDQTLQFENNMFHYTNRLTRAATEAAAGYVVNASSLGMAFRSEREAILETKMADGTVWAKDTLPMLGIPMDTYFYEGKSDRSSIGADTADMTRVFSEHHGFAIDVATVVAHNTDPATYASPIVKFVINKPA